MDEVSIPYDNSKPTYVLVVEPVGVAQESGTETVKASGDFKIGNKKSDVNIPIKGSYSEERTFVTHSLLNRQIQITQQLTSALSGVKNFQPVDSDVFKRDPQKIKVQGNEKGPYLVRAVITEWNEVAESSSTTVRVPWGFQR